MNIRTKFTAPIESTHWLGLLQHHYQLANGGTIHINPSHKGEFTTKANNAGEGIQEYADHVMANRTQYPASTIKQANFARNAASWKKAGGGILGDNTSDILTQDQRGQIRRIGFTDGWDPISGAPQGTTTLRKTSGLGTYFSPKSLNVNDSVSSYDVNNPSNLEDLPHVGARKVVGQFARQNPDVNSLKYGEVDYSRIPGYAGNQSGIANGVYEFNQNLRDVPTTNQVKNYDFGSLPEVESPIQAGKPKDFTPSMYTPDKQSMSQFIDSIRARTANTRQYNNTVKKRELGGKLTVKGLIK